MSFLDLKFIDQNIESDQYDKAYFKELFYIFLYTMFLFLFSAIIFSKGKPFKKEWYSNKRFLGFAILNLVYILLISLCFSSTNYSISYFINWFIRRLEYGRSESVFVVSFSFFVVGFMYLYEKYLLTFLFEFIPKIVKKRIKKELTASEMSLLNLHV